MKLEKANISVVIGGGGAVEVLFNPNEYRLSGSNQFAEVAIPGLPSPPLQFVKGNSRTLTMQLFFDTFEKGSDVREHTRKVTRLLDIDPELHAPPVVLFTWGDLNFMGVLERAEQRFTLFYASGIPARATVDVTFKEFTEGTEQAGKNRSATFDKRRTVRRGDTLSGIAGREYGDPGNWRPIALVNGIDDPLTLYPGQVLVIPAIE
ncbi:LysM peptidoglycan-binding domain-containing protein [Desulfuromonas acetexigens]|uniref:LysM peptidoglycan-binding domain-containing protein n=1 Tax=Trichloromonas acetexigens TaxID=38815 RepID=A0A550JHK9_9BACT|nr:LysM peptidoglycan-binding domain-containing protein [Desulfuromonas acetexigens]TRO82663.1 LysM peptidoglycan-binding domain-containing protein [Desulfuromonas acetexigens]